MASWSKVDAALVRLRLTADRLFPDGPAPPRITGRRALVCTAIAAAAIVVQMARMWPSAPLDSIWAEDGIAWLEDAMGRGFLDALVTPYNGYLQTVSRLVAEPVSWLGVGAFAPAMALCGAAIVTGCAFVVWRASAAHIREPYLRAVLAGLVVALPIVGSETLDNVTNTIWFLLFAAFWILLWRPATFARATSAAALVFLAAISTAGVLLLLPIAILRLLAIRDRRDGVILAALAAGLAIQIGLSWGKTTLLGEAPGIQLALEPHWSWELVPAYFQRIAGGVIGGQWINGNLWEQLGTPLIVLLAALLIAFVVAGVANASTRVRMFVGLAVAISVAMFLVSGYRRWETAGRAFLWPDGISNVDASHYMIVPTLILLSALFVWLDAKPPRFAAATWNRVRIATVALLAVGALTSFDVSDSVVRGSPRFSDSLDTARAYCAGPGEPGVDVAERTVEVEVAPTFGNIRTTMLIPCDRLVEDAGG